MPIHAKDDCPTGRARPSLAWFAMSAIHDRRVAAKAAETYERISTAFAAEQAVLDGLQGGGDGRA